MSFRWCVLLLIWWIFMNHQTISKVVTTVTTTTTTDRTPDSVESTDDTHNDSNSKQKQAKHEEIHIHLENKKEVNVSIHKSSKQDKNTFATINIHLKPSPSISTSYYYSKQCSLQFGTLNNLCSDEIKKLDKSLEIIQSFISSLPQTLNQSAIDNELKQYSNIICPLSEEWISFIKCYCTKCESKLIDIPNQSQWNQIWNKTSFCNLYNNNNNNNNNDLCHINNAIRKKYIDIEEIFKSVWNEEIKSEKNMNKIQDNIDRNAMDAEIEKVEESASIVDVEDIDYGLESVSIMFTTHPIIYIWTILFASCITLLSFFIFYR